MQHINANNAPEALGAYSHAVKVQNIVYLSGQIGIDPKSMLLCSEDVTKQAQQVFTNLQIVCEASGGDLSKIVKLTVYLADISDSTIVNEIMQNYFSCPYPARAMLEVAKLPKNAKIEIDAVMAVKE